MVLICVTQQHSWNQYIFEIIDDTNKEKGETENDEKVNVPEWVPLGNEHL
jgi:hypothetical protein